VSASAPEDITSHPGAAASDAVNLHGNGLVTAVNAPVAIDARAAARTMIGGVERVTIEMSTRLPRLAPGRYAVLKPPTALAYRAGHLWEQAVLPAAARRASLIYCPANLAPVASRRNVVVIHDLAALSHPEWYSRLYASYQRRMMPLVARRARRLIAPSEFSRAELVDGLGIDPQRISIVPGGVDRRFSPSVDPEPARHRLRLRSPYVLVVGTRIARKNVAALAVAGRRLRELGIELVSAGSSRAYMRPGEAPPLRTLGYVEDALLPGLYAGALALAMPSLHEGFGLPVLEAMASGVPVVAANRAALPETCGGAGLLVEPGEPEAVADAVIRAATDEDTRGALVAAGLERAAQFSWDRSALLTDEAIARVLAEETRLC
jgi:glycosyltransferase involved in cell wall biosynthesis